MSAGNKPTVINEADLREMSAAERRALAHSLATIDYTHPLLGINLARGRKLGLLVSVVSCAVLLGWIIVLGLTLHRSFHALHWRGAWVGFDFILLLAFAATGWAFWRGRQIVIAFLIVTGTLLCCDAWFDVVLDAGSSDVWVSAGDRPTPPLHLAFRAPSRAAVDAFHAAAVATGGRDNGAPGLRTRYHANYYAAYVLDPDGHNIEAVCHDAP